MAEIPGWKYVLAFFIDLLFAVIVLGGLIAWAFGELHTEDGHVGFNLTGLPAILALGAMVAYWVIGNRTGGTLGKRIFKIPAGRRAP
jgi:uncharacterized RDD family membrane protein YckC